ncbi:hypothetical protein CC86DRAFT_75099 [Ophiobolus disseminans]|uniref:Uncharacterized protein n=1 Tax=Ophiobolus disseminans TaxID=1469910 RepID=A0A6A6ZPJ8_9PLEO|nr:hypothetical protein CC86DRAFT_75099 [Ophiobolus disseminans]
MFVSLRWRCCRRSSPLILRTLMPYSTPPFSPLSIQYRYTEATVLDPTIVCLVVQQTRGCCLKALEYHKEAGEDVKGRGWYEQCGKWGTCPEGSRERSTGLIMGRRYGHQRKGKSIYPNSPFLRSFHQQSKRQMITLSQAPEVMTSTLTQGNE